jgi:hypothetical protein
MVKKTKRTEGESMKNGTMTLAMCAMVLSLGLSSCTLPEMSFAEQLIEDIVDRSSIPAQP